MQLPRLSRKETLLSFRGLESTAEHQRRSGKTYLTGELKLTAQMGDAQAEILVIGKTRRHRGTSEILVIMMNSQSTITLEIPFNAA
jgi:hypothetical protein